MDEIRYVRFSGGLCIICRKTTKISSMIIFPLPYMSFPDVFGHLDFQLFLPDPFLYGVGWRILDRVLDISFLINSLIHGEKKKRFPSIFLKFGFF